MQRGENLNIAAPATAVNGEPVFAGAIRDIALHSAAISMPLDLATGGVWELAKVAADNIALSDVIYWDSSLSLATTTATDNDQLGVAVSEAGTSAALVTVRVGAF